MSTPRPPADRTPEALRPLLGTTVVVDTDASFIYLGVLERADAEFLVLNNVDVHDMGKGGLSKESYIHESTKIGVRPNRNRAWVRMDRVLSISPLDEVKTFGTA